MRSVECCVLSAESYLGADVSFHFIFLCRKVKPRRAVDSIAIEQRHGRAFELLAHGYQLFRKRRAFEKAEGGSRMVLNVLSGHCSLEQYSAVFENFRVITNNFRFLIAIKEQPDWNAPCGNTSNWVSSSITRACPPLLRSRLVISRLC